MDMKLIASRRSLSWPPPRVLSSPAVPPPLCWQSPPCWPTPTSVHESCPLGPFAHIPARQHTLWTHRAPCVLFCLLLFSWLYLFSSFSPPSDFCSVLSFLSVLLLRRKRPISSSSPLISPLDTFPPRWPHLTIYVFISLLPSSCFLHFLSCSISSS